MRRLALRAWGALERLAVSVATLGLLPLSLWGWADDWLRSNHK